MNWTAHGAIFGAQMLIYLNVSFGYMNVCSIDRLIITRCVQFSLWVDFLLSFLRKGKVIRGGKLG